MAHVFTLVLNQHPDDAQYGKLVDLGYLLTGSLGDLPVATVDRDGPALAEAIVATVADLDAIGLHPVRVLDEDLLTLADIADRAGLSRESVRRYSTGQRGGGGFPPPVNPGRDGTVFYRWSEVAPWLREHGVDLPDTDATLTVANLLLQARQHRDTVDWPTLAGLLG